MARFSGLRSELDPYAFESNSERVEAARQAGPARMGTPRPAGLSVVVLNLDQPQLIAKLWEGWTEAVKELEARGIAAELLIGDTGSTDQVALKLLDDPPPHCRVQYDLSYHFSRCNNSVFEHTAFDTVLFMNNDVILHDEPASLRGAYEELHRSADIGAVGSVLFFEDGTVQHAGIDFFSQPDLFAFCYHPAARGSLDLAIGEAFDAPAATGAFLMIRSEHFSAVGGFDESYSAECQDVDLCLRLARRGLRVRVVHTGSLVHLENGTRERGEENWRDRALFVRRWSSFVEAM